jgi:ribosomal protein S18 acetylase RimI-like enzyme
MVEVYSKLADFPSPDEQPEYYQMLANIGSQLDKPDTELLVALNDRNEVCGGVVYFSDMAQYGSGGTATAEKNASGFRLLAVSPAFQGHGIAKKLTAACIDKARQDGNEKLVIHTTEAMQVAWKMYEKFGFKRATDLDFMQGQLPVFGFRLYL